MGQPDSKVGLARLLERVGAGWIVIVVVLTITFGVAVVGWYLPFSPAQEGEEVSVGVQLEEFREDIKEELREEIEAELAVVEYSSVSRELLGEVWKVDLWYGAYGVFLIGGGVVFVDENNIGGGVPRNGSYLWVDIVVDGGQVDRIYYFTQGESEGVE